MLSEAVIKFQSQAISEIFPAKGPVRTQIVGKITEDKTKQAENGRAERKKHKSTDENNGMLKQLPTLFQTNPTKPNTTATHPHQKRF